MAKTKAAPRENQIRIGYYRPDAQYSGWTLYAFGDTTEDLGAYGSGPVEAAGINDFGLYFDVAVTADAQDLGFVIHRPSAASGGDAKDPGPDMHLDVSRYREAWVISEDHNLYTVRPSPAQLLEDNFARQQAFWIDRTTVAIRGRYLQTTWRYELACSPTAGLQIGASGKLEGVDSSIALDPFAQGLRPEQLTQFPQLADYAVFRLAENVTVDQISKALTGQVALAASDPAGVVRYVTGLQTAGVLDDLYAYGGALGPTFRQRRGVQHMPGCAVRMSLWAPTAQTVTLQLFENASDNTPANTVPLTATHGVWSECVDSSWCGKYYLYALVVYVPNERRFATNVVTDPYSTDLALNGLKSRITDLNDPGTKPPGWDESRSPPLAARNDLSIYELHVRDFSAADESVPERYRGTYVAFADPGTHGMRHLTALAEAGLKAVHLLPTFHFGSVNEDKGAWKSYGDLNAFPPDSAQQQALVSGAKDQDAYNWGYDPVHYLAPEGSYAFDPDSRVREYRAMVLGLHGAGLRVVQDQVFNHTVSSGQAATSVLDRIVPGYYYRLDPDGNVENASCCSDTASEHRMMEKLMVDAVVQSARDYKIDGFRFDLMGFHLVSNMKCIQEELCRLSLDRDGVDGSMIYLYGEGWRVGETATDAPGSKASQMNLFGLGIGTFNDRMRDGIRGGGPFSDHRLQGFATGLFTASSDYTNGNQGSDDQRSTLLLQSDWIKLGLAGNLREFLFTDRSGRSVKGSQVNYNGQSAGYTESPLENVNFYSVHDNQALFDGIQLKSRSGDPLPVRVRRQVLAMSLIALGQGVPFFLAGDDLLRSKGMDKNSFDSGDWFNRLDFTYTSNNWGTGLPLAGDNAAEWPVMQPLLADATLRPAPGDIAHARDAFREFLRIRQSSALFRIKTAGEVQSNLQFLDRGTPGLIVMELKANGRDYGAHRAVVTVFNTLVSAVDFQHDALMDQELKLHPVQAASSDSLVRESGVDAGSGTAHVPALTTAVFVTQTSS